MTWAHSGEVQARTARTDTARSDDVFFITKATYMRTYYQCQHENENVFSLIKSAYRQLRKLCIFPRMIFALTSLRNARARGFVVSGCPPGRSERARRISRAEVRW
jgi:hypothetical protein